MSFGRCAQRPKESKFASIFQKDKKGDQGLVNHTSISGSVMEQLILETISRHMKDSKMIRSSQHSFKKGKQCSTSLVTFYDDLPSSLGVSHGYCLLGLH